MMFCCLFTSFIHPSCLAFVVEKPCNYRLEPESVAGTTAPARAETSQLGALGSELGLYGLAKVPCDHPIQERVHHVCSVHMSCFVFVVPFIYQKERP